MYLGRRCWGRTKYSPMLTSLLYSPGPGSASKRLPLASCVDYGQSRVHKKRFVVDVQRGGEAVRGWRWWSPPAASRGPSGLFRQRNRPPRRQRAAGRSLDASRVAESSGSFEKMNVQQEKLASLVQYKYPQVPTRRLYSTGKASRLLPAWTAVNLATRKNVSVAVAGPGASRVVDAA